MFRHYQFFLQKNKKYYFLGILVLVIVDIVRLFVPQVLKGYTDALESGSLDGQLIGKFALLLGAITLTMVLCRILWRVLIVFTAVRFEGWIRQKFFQHLTTLPRNYYHRHKTGDLMAHGTNDIMTIRHAFAGGIIMSVDALVITVSTIVMMIFTVNWKMTLLAILPMPLIAIGVIVVGRIIHRKFARVQRVFSQLSDKTQESFSGIRVIKAFHQENLDLKDFNRMNEKNFRENMSLAKVQAFFFPGIRFIGALSALIGIMVGGYYVLHNIVSLGSFVAFINYIEMLVWPMMAVGFFMNLLQRGMASIQRMNRIFQEKSDLANLPSIKKPLDSSLIIKNLDFTYPGEGKPVLQDISLGIPSGGSLGILGHTGSGKTTLINLLLRLYNVPRGKIFIGGMDINDLSIYDLREYVGVVPQDHFLFSTKIADNIALSDREINMEKVIESAGWAQVHDEIQEFPHGYDTFLGERGVNLSGGQRQRVSIARLLYKNSPILIFDDCLSAVDTKTEENILRELSKKMQGHTAIAISHRISTLKNMDRIIVLSEGRVIEEGTHEELLELKGQYYNVYEKQLLEEKLEEEDYGRI